MKAEKEKKERSLVLVAAAAKEKERELKAKRAAELKESQRLYYATRNAMHDAKFEEQSANAWAAEMGALGGITPALSHAASATLSLFNAVRKPEEGASEAPPTFGTRSGAWGNAVGNSFLNKMRPQSAAAARPQSAGGGKRFEWLMDDGLVDA